jgi:hypothetical protein
VTVVGHAATIAAGEWITASGEWVRNRTDNGPNRVQAGNREIFQEKQGGD